VQSPLYACPIEIRNSTIAGRYRLPPLGVAVMTHLRSFDELPLTDGRNRKKFGNKLHRRSQRSRRLFKQKLAKEPKVRQFWPLNSKFRIQPPSDLSSAIYRLFGYRLFAKRALFGQRLRQLGQKKVGSRTAMFTSTGTSIVRTRHSQFIKSDAPAALCNH
jgi:hypothetical protein